MCQPEDTSHHEEPAVQHQVNKLFGTYVFLQPPLPLIIILRDKKLYYMFKDHSREMVNRIQDEEGGN